MDRKSLVGYSPWGCQGVSHVLVTKQQIQQKTLDGRDTELCFQRTESIYDQMEIEEESTDRRK